MSQKLKDLREKRAQAWEQLKAINERSKDAAMNAEDQAAWDKGNAEIDAIGGEITAEEKRLDDAAAREKRLAEIEATNRAALGDGRIGVDAGRRREENPERVAGIDVRAIALQGWLRAGRGLDLTAEHRDACRRAGVNPGSTELALSADYRYGGPAWCSRDTRAIREFRAGLDVATGGAGQETIPEGFMAELEAVTLAYADVRRVCRVIRTASGNPLPWPKVDDTGNVGVKLDEATSFGTSVDPTFSAVTFNAYKYSSKPVFVSQELLDDTAFNLSSEIAGMLGERLGRIEASATTVGDGTGDPNGIVTASGMGHTTAVAAAFTADELLALIHSLDPSNRNSASTGFMFHDTALLYIRKLKDGNGQYLWQPGLQVGAPNSIAGYPYTINQQMEPLVSGVPVTAKKHVLFGDFSKYVIRLVAADRFYRLDERYRDTDQSAFVAFRRLDSDTIKASALKHLLQA
jgi:HK97 family phage major capsid protein